MTEEEKELEQKIKQYQYENEENNKKLERLSNDLNKHHRKKSFTYRANKTIGGIVFVWAGLGFVIVGFLLVWALLNLINGFNSFDPVKYVENKYDIDLEIISREAENKILTYKVKPKEWKYSKIEFTLVRHGRQSTYDDFDSRYLKYIIEKIDDKELLKSFKIQEYYDDNNLLVYKLLYEGELQSEEQKIKDLKNYILNFNKDVEKIINLDKIIMEMT